MYEENIKYDYEKEKISWSFYNLSIMYFIRRKPLALE